MQHDDRASRDCLSGKRSSRDDPDVRPCHSNLPSAVVLRVLRSDDMEEGLSERVDTVVEGFAGPMRLLRADGENESLSEMELSQGPAESRAPPRLPSLPVARTGQGSGSPLDPQKISHRFPNCSGSGEYQFL